MTQSLVDERTDTSAPLSTDDGVPTIALCGKLWLPTKDAQRFPVCPECKEKWEALDE